MSVEAAEALYEGMVRYLVAHGWMRDDVGSAWWWRQGEQTALIGEAVEQQLEEHGVDLRAMLADEPRRPPAARFLR